MASELSIRTAKLSHRYSSGEQVVNQVDLTVPKGAIYGFLGPNGAGKTTTLRLVLGLLKKQEGEIYINDKPLLEHRTDHMQKIGSMIESPSIYAHLSATENLIIQQTIFGCDKKRIPFVLDLVKLGNTGAKPAGKFSLGMKQRLAIAMALLHEPELLILDEPSNGLDPNGMIEMRELLLYLHKENGITILVSSHLLSEIEKLATHVGVIHKGSIRFQGTMHELHAAQLKEHTTILHTTNNQAAIAYLSNRNIACSLLDNAIQMSGVSTQEMVDINKDLVMQQIGVYQIENTKHNLETIFMNLIK